MLNMGLSDEHSVEVMGSFPTFPSVESSSFTYLKCDKIQYNDRKRCMFFKWTVGVGTVALALVGIGGMCLLHSESSVFDSVSTDQSSSYETMVEATKQYKASNSLRRRARNAQEQFDEDEIDNYQEFEVFLEGTNATFDSINEHSYHSIEQEEEVNGYIDPPPITITALPPTTETGMEQNYNIETTAAGIPPDDENESQYGVYDQDKVNEDEGMANDAPILSNTETTTTTISSPTTGISMNEEYSEYNIDTFQDYGQEGEEEIDEGEGGDVPDMFLGETINATPPDNEEGQFPPPPPPVETAVEQNYSVNEDNEVGQSRVYDQDEDISNDAPILSNIETTTTTISSPSADTSMNEEYNIDAIQDYGQEEKEESDTGSDASDMLLGETANSTTLPNNEEGQFPPPPTETTAEQKYFEDNEKSEEGSEGGDALIALTTEINTTGIPPYDENGSQYGVYDQDENNDQEEVNEDEHEKANDALLASNTETTTISSPVAGNTKNEEYITDEGGDIPIAFLGENTNTSIPNNVEDQFEQNQDVTNKDDGTEEDESDEDNESEEEKSDEESDVPIALIVDASSPEKEKSNEKDEQTKPLGLLITESTTTSSSAVSPPSTEDRNKTDSNMTKEKYQKTKYDKEDETERPIMHTFYQEVKQGEEHLLRVWEKEWRRAGFQTKVLNMTDAEKHPFYEEMKEVIEPLWKELYNGLCFYRWIAMAHVGGGWMSDYDTFPTNFPMKEAKELPYGGNFTSYELHVPSLLSGSATEWDRVSRLIVEAVPKITDDIKSDMYAFLQLRDEGTHNINFISPTDHGVLNGYFYTAPRRVNCATLRNSRAVHLSHYSTQYAVKKGLFPAMVRGKNPMKRRGEGAKTFLSDWRNQCKIGGHMDIE